MMTSILGHCSLYCEQYFASNALIKLSRCYINSIIMKNEIGCKFEDLIKLYIWLKNSRHYANVLKLKV